MRSEGYPKGLATRRAERNRNSPTSNRSLLRKCLRYGLLTLAIVI